MRGGIRWAAAIGVALLVGGCGNDAVGEIIDEAPTLGPLVEERVLWDATSSDAISTVLSANLYGDSAVIVGDERDNFRLAVVDAATGTPRWSLDGGHLPGGAGVALWNPTPNVDLPVVAGPPDDFLVFVQYYRGGDCAHPIGWCTREENETRRVERGVAALSGEDGSVRWMAPILSGDEIQILNMTLVAAGANTVMIGVSDFNNDPALSSAVALNAADGSHRWEQPGVAVDFIIGSTVFGRIPSRTNHLGATEGDVVALDVTSGDRRWDLSQRHVASVARTGVDNFVAVEVENSDGERDMLVLDSATGREAARLGQYSFSCSSDERSLVVCVDVVHNTLVSFQVDEGEVRVSGRLVADGDRSYRSSGVLRGRVFLEDEATSDLAAKNVVVDRSANVLTEQAPGQLVTISDDYAIFRTTEDGDISVHAVKP